MRRILWTWRRAPAAVLLGLAVIAATATAGFAAVSASTANCSPTITSESWGSVDGQPVDRYTLKNCNRMEVKILTYGGILQSISVPDRRNRVANVTLGFDNLDDYVARNPYFGCITGRYANRIALGTFTLDGETVQPADQQRPELAPRRRQGLRQARLGRHADQDLEHRRPRAHVHEPGR